MSPAIWSTSITRIYCRVTATSFTPLATTTTYLLAAARHSSHKRFHNSFATMADKPNVPSETMRLPKKLIVLCDGTWQNSDRGWVKDHFWSTPKPQVPSNVTRIARAVRQESKNLHPQVVYYQAGVGTSWSIADKVFGGGLALGISEHIREAYGFIAHNYAKGPSGSEDEIFLLGFSRGAFTARSVGGLIGTLGLLTKTAMQYFFRVFEDFENAGVAGYKITMADAVPGFVVKADPSDVKEYLKEYKKQLIKHDLTRDVSIQAIAVWDTVGTLGLPIHPWLQKLGASSAIRKYRFFDTGISNHVKHAFHALALDERRAAFDATVWERQEDNVTTKLKQVWFAGAHSNIGGSYEDSNAADLSLAWMVDQLSPFIEFDEEYIMDQFQNNLKKYYYLEDQPKDANKRQWTWGAGTINESLSFPTSLAGSTTRAPGRYCELNYLTGKPDADKPALLRDTHEYIHSSVRARYELHGKDASLRKDYNSPALKNWTLISDGDDKIDGADLPIWKYKNLDDAKDLANDHVLPEAPLGTLERKLLDLDPQTKSFLFESSSD